MQRRMYERRAIVELATGMEATTQGESLPGFLEQRAAQQAAFNRAYYETEATQTTQNITANLRTTANTTDESPDLPF